jgi:hypothetical protein
MTLRGSTIIIRWQEVAFQWSAQPSAYQEYDLNLDHPVQMLGVTHFPQSSQSPCNPKGLSWYVLGFVLCLVGATRACVAGASRES